MADQGTPTDPNVTQQSNEDAYADALEKEALICETENDRLRAEIAAIEEELNRSIEVERDERVSKGSRRVRELEHTVAHLEATLSTMQATRPTPASDPLFTRSELVVAEEAFVQLGETVAELEKALQWTRARKADEDALLERDLVFLSDAETMHSVFAQRVEKAQAEPLPSPDGREIILRTKKRLRELDRRFDLLQRGLRELIDRVLANGAEDERFDPRWVEADAARRRRNGSGEGAGGEDEEKLFDLRHYLRASDLAAEERRTAVSTRTHELKSLFETLLNRSIEISSASALAYAEQVPSQQVDSNHSIAQTVSSSATHAAVSLDNFFETGAPDELVDFVVRAGIAEEAEDSSEAQTAAVSTGEQFEGFGARQADGVAEARKREKRRIRLVEVGVRIDE
ncbi:hypothetical protein JCM10908_001321 [Rhodotorula pacifica]|uniref:uncharacterized protein n=1 Tax=Rhodotorula pacifica TaxID=1495444 RepID=UPI0031799732